MPTYIWSGTLTFGLVTIPVQLLPATRSRPTALTMLHEKDTAPLERRMVCPEDDEVVEREEQVRGFEVGDGEYVVVTDDELEGLAPERSKAIEIEEFVELDDIDPLYFDRPYYLKPGEGGERPYWLLVQALRDAEKAGIARFVLRDREHLVAVWVVEDVLCLTTLHHQRQRVSPEGLVPEKTRVSHDDLDDLVNHIEDSTRAFDPAAYDDEDEIRLMELVREKAKDEGVEKGPGARRRNKVSEKRLLRKIDRTLEKIEGEG